MQQLDTEFYIGWQAKAPPKQSIFLRKIIVLVTLLAILVAAMFVYFQKGFSSSVFEYNALTTLEGKLVVSPVPMLLVYYGENPIDEPIVQEFLLVGEGKRGAEQVIKSKTLKDPGIVQGSSVEVKGFLIYYDGQTLFELRDIRSCDKLTGQSKIEITLVDAGKGTISGEIADPKCFFGVMKPGDGKTHLACAARCIAGGIPPVLKRTIGNDQAAYYIILDHQGRPVNTAILPYVGDHVFIKGQIKSSGDWKFIFLEEGKSITRVSKELALGSIMCNPGN